MVALAFVGTGVAQTQTAAATARTAPNTGCEVQVQVDDSLRFAPARIEVPASCDQFTVLLTHIGRLPKVASPRNWVLTKTELADAVARDAERAGAVNNWIQPEDERVLAASSVVGRGETVRVVIPVKRLAHGVSYTYLSTIPGFSPVLRGTLSVTPH